METLDRRGLGTAYGRVLRRSTLNLHNASYESEEEVEESEDDEDCDQVDTEECLGRVTMQNSEHSGRRSREKDR